MNASMNNQCDICCIGGGISGLSAVKHVACQKTSFKKIILLEAKSNLGGRIHGESMVVFNPAKPHDKHYIQVDVGAMSLHGTNPSVNKTLISILNDESCNVDFRNMSGYTECYQQSTSPLRGSNYCIDTESVVNESYPVLYWFNKHKKFVYNNFKPIQQTDDLISQALFQHETMMESISSMKTDTNCNNDDDGSKTDAEYKDEKQDWNIEDLSLKQWLLNKLKDIEYNTDNININQNSDCKNRDEFINQCLSYANCAYGNEEAANIDKIGILQYIKLANNWIWDSHNINMLGQCSKIINYFENLFQNDKMYKDKIKILLNHAVTRIDYGRDFIWIEKSGQNNNESKPATKRYKCVVTCNNGSKIYCNQVIISVPLQMLKNKAITFVPALPNAKQNAIDKLYIGKGGKIFMQFNKAFWASNITVNGSVVNGNINTMNNTQCIRCVDSFISEFLFFTIFKENGELNKSGFDVHLCAMFLMGCQQDKLFDKLSWIEIKDKIWKQLMNMFGKDVMDEVKCLSYFEWNWSNVSYIGCSYSSPMKNTGNMRQALREPVDDCLYFCGEATADTFPCMQASLGTGIAAADAIMDKLA